MLAYHADVEQLTICATEGPVDLTVEKEGSRAQRRMRATLIFD